MKKVVCRDKDQNKIEVAIEDLEFRPSVYGIIFNEDKTKILLSKQWDGYDYPGGGIKKGERIQEALEREIYEEVGVKISTNNIKLVECTDDFYISKKGKALHSILLFYVIDKFEGKPNIKNIVKSEANYISGFEWVRIGNAKNIKWYNPMNNEQLVKKALEILNTNS